MVSRQSAQLVIRILVKQNYADLKASETNKW